MKDSISTNELARICGVSQGTVDRALNNRKGISEKTKQRILDIAKEYGYKPNIHARSIAGGKSMLIGVVVFDLANQYFSDMLMNIEKYCAGKSYSTVVMFTDKDPQKEIECIKHLYHMISVVIPVHLFSFFTFELKLFSKHIWIRRMVVIAFSLLVLFVGGYFWKHSL